MEYPLDNIVVMYMAQVPREWPPLPTVPQTQPSDKIPFPNQNIANSTPTDLDKLLDAIFDLKTGNAEIYRLKALAYEIKHRGEEP